MGLKDNWVDKINGVDINSADDINQVARAVIELEEKGAADGENGATFTPSVSAEGVISWTNDRELPNPTPVNIKGEKGDNGTDGSVWHYGTSISGTGTIIFPLLEAKGSDYYLNTNNGNVYIAEDSDSRSASEWKYVGNLKGVKGDKGDTGIGITSVTRTSGNGAAGTTDTYTIKYTDNTTSTFTVYNGTNGTNGTSVTVTNVSESTEDGGNNVVTFSDGTTITVKNGSKGNKGDSVTTAQVIADMTKDTWTFTLEDGSTVTKVVPLV